MNTLKAFVIIVGLSVAFAALPPGYEDEAWCPEGSCLRAKEITIGFSGPAHMFKECYDKESTAISEEIWTGSKTNTAVPEGWHNTRCEDTNAHHSRRR